MRRERARSRRRRWHRRQGEERGVTPSANARASDGGTSSPIFQARHTFGHSPQIAGDDRPSMSQRLVQDATLRGELHIRQNHKMSVVEESGDLRDIHEAVDHLHPAARQSRDLLTKRVKIGGAFGIAHDAQHAVGQEFQCLQEDMQTFVRSDHSEEQQPGRFIRRGRSRGLRSRRALVPHGVRRYANRRMSRTQELRECRTQSFRVDHQRRTRPPRRPPAPRGALNVSAAQMAEILDVMHGRHDLDAASSDLPKVPRREKRRIFLKMDKVDVRPRPQPAEEDSLPPHVMRQTRGRPFHFIVKLIARFQNRQPRLDRVIR